MGASGALLVVLPMSESSYRTRLGSSDYLRAARLDPSSHWSGYAAGPLVALRSLAAVAREYGYRVVADATLADLCAGTGACEAVVLLSHWKGPDIRRDDLESDDSLDEALRRLGASESVPLAPLRAQLALDPPKTAASLCAALDAFVAEEQAAPNPDDDAFEIVATAFTLETMRRDEIDHALAGLIRPGNRLELADALHSRDDVADAIAPGFGGTLDLTTCTSTVLSDHLERRARGSFRTVQFQEAQEPESASLILEQVIRLHAGGLPYTEARLRAYEDFVRAVSMAHPPVRDSIWARLTRPFRRAR